MGNIKILDPAGLCDEAFRFSGSLSIWRFGEGRRMTTRPLIFDVLGAELDSKGRFSITLLHAGATWEVKTSQVSNEGFWIMPEGDAQKIFGTDEIFQDRLLARVIVISMANKSRLPHGLDWREMSKLTADIKGLDKYIEGHRRI